MVKKIIKISLVFVALYLLILFAYQKLFVFSVLPGEEAIVTRAGRTIGDPKKSGYHKKRPFFDDIHYIKVDDIRSQKRIFQKGGDYSLNVYWNINDSKKYFLSSKQFDLPLKFETTMLKAIEYIDNSMTVKELDSISQKKKHDFSYNDKYLETIFNYFQKETMIFGIKIKRIDILKQD